MASFTRFRTHAWAALARKPWPDSSSKVLRQRGLARDSEDGKSIPMQPMVRALILVLLSQILRPHGEKLGAELSPATDQPQLVQALRELLSLPDTPSAAHVVGMDLETISVDLSLV